MTVLYGLLAAGFSGTGDFFGGLASRHGRVEAIVFHSHIVGIVATLVVAPIVGGSPTAVDLWWGALAGVSGGLGILFLYRGFEVSEIAVVSPVAAVGAAGWPVLFALLEGERPGPVVSLGLVVGVGAIWLISRANSLGPLSEVRRGAMFGVLSGMGFGGLLILLSRVGGDAGIWPLGPARVGGALVVGVIVLFARKPIVPHPQTWGLLAVAGTVTILGNGAFILGTGAGSLAVLSVLAAMFPAATVILARLFLHERLTRRRLVGLGLALLAVGLVAAG